MKKSKRERLVLLDTHAIIHRAYHALPPLTVPAGSPRAGEPAGAVYGLMTMLMKIVKDLKPDYLVAAYDLPGPTHRHEVYKEYKGTRKDIDEALIGQITRSRDALAAFNIPIIEKPGFEADDVIGTLAVAHKKKYDVIIASGDMDTLQLVDDHVRVYTLRKGLSDTILYDDEQVKERYGFGPEHITDYKGLAGDTSDNIIGIPGIGEKTATELIQKFGSIEKIYKALKKNKNALVDAGFRERVQTLVSEHQDEADFSKVLATIRTDAPIKWETPPAHFLESIDSAALAAFCQTMGFRSLVPKVRELVMAAQPTLVPEVVAPNVDTNSTLFKQCAVAYSLLHSDTASPTVDDILGLTREETLERALPKLQSLLARESLDGVYKKIEEPLIRVIDAINAYGIVVDVPYLKELSHEYHKEVDERAQKIYDAAGVEFNISSPKQLGDVLFGKLGLAGAKQKKTATGQLSTKESELQKLAADNPIVNDILAYRELSKLLGTYIDAIPPLVDANGRLHTTFVQIGAATGRLASRDPNLQNIPNKTELGRRIRHAFVAPQGSVFLACDYSQIELRLAAMLSGDEKLTDIFIRGEDVHAAVAAQVFGVEQSEVTKEQRRRAKVINFGILYGMGVNALREQLGTDRKEAQEFYDKYFETFSTLARYLDKTKETAARTGYTVTHFGRRRYFPGFKSPLPFIRASAERMAINAPIQGTQADMIKVAMVRIHNLLEKDFAGSAHIVLQIHDELVLEVKEESLKEVSSAVKREMEGVLTRADTSIPILVSSSVGTAWDEMEPI